MIDLGYLGELSPGLPFLVRTTSTTPGMSSAGAARRAALTRFCGRHQVAWSTSARWAAPTASPTRSTTRDKSSAGAIPQVARSTRSCGRRPAAWSISARWEALPATRSISTRLARSWAAPPRRAASSMRSCGQWRAAWPTSARSAARARGARRDGINDAGQVVGLVNDSDDHAFYWTAAGGMVALPTLTGIESAARAINNAGQLAGYGDIATGDAHAVIWSQASRPADHRRTNHSSRGLGPGAGDKRSSPAQSGQRAGQTRWRTPCKASTGAFSGPRALKSSCSRWRSPSGFSRGRSLLARVSRSSTRQRAFESLSAASLDMPSSAALKGCRGGRSVAQPF